MIIHSKSTKSTFLEIFLVSLRKKYFFQEILNPSIRNTVSKQERLIDSKQVSVFNKAKLMFYWSKYFFTC